MLPILEISNLTKSYGAVKAVDDVSLHIARGEICGLIGPNGSGKSTFFDCSTGLGKPDSGKVMLDGQDITGWSLNRIAREGRMLRSFQKTVVFKALDVEENLIIAGQMFTFPGLFSTFSLGGCHASAIAALRERARELIRMAGLWDVRHMPAGNLSGGQQKLIQFASMLMPEPKIILLDEPMAGINPKIIERVVETIRYANQTLGVSFLVIEHNIDVVTSICERVVVLDQGRKLAEGTPERSCRTSRSGRPISVANSNLSIKNLRAGYGSLDILNGVDLDVPQGQFVALMGPNGAGKSTLLKTPLRHDHDQGGQHRLAGQGYRGYKSRAILAEGISFVPQGRCNFPVMTVDENLQMAAYTLRDAAVERTGTMSTISSRS